MSRIIRCLALLVTTATGVRLQKSHHINDYFWPSSRGRVGSYSTSAFMGPSNMNESSPTWRFHHPFHRFGTVPYSTAIDGEKNLYLSTDLAMYKLNPEGETVWEFKPEWPVRTTIFSAASLNDGRVHFATENGRIWALDMESGKMLWTTKVCHRLSNDTGYVSSWGGMVVAAVNATEENANGANGLVVGLQAWDGKPVWMLKPDKPTSSFLASFPGDGSVLWQDWEGKAYRHSLYDGKLLWKAGGEQGTKTTAAPLLANDIFYTLSSNTSNPARDEAGPDHTSPGFITARNISNGVMLWRSPVPMPPSSTPALGRTPGRAGLSLVVPAGYPCSKGGKTGVFAFDAQTGTRLWSFEGPSQAEEHQAGVLEGLPARQITSTTHHSFCTTAWSAPTIDARGTVYVGHEDGLVFALRDANANGKLEHHEVSTFPTGGTFFGTSSPALAPYMFAIANADSLYVFNVSAGIPL